MWNVKIKRVAPRTHSHLDTLDDLALEDRQIFFVLLFFSSFCNV